MKELKTNDYLYGKDKNRANFIINYAIKHTDKKTIVIDLEKNINLLYPLVQLNTIRAIFLNNDINITLDYLENLDNINTVIVNGYQNIDKLEEELKKEFLTKVEEFKKNTEIECFFFGKDLIKGFPRKIELKKTKSKNIEKKIFKINKNIDLNNDEAYLIKRTRVKIIEGNII